MEFRKSIQSESIIVDFSGQEDFKIRLHKNIYAAAISILSTHDVVIQSQSLAQPSILNGEVDVIEEDLGILDYQIKMIEAFETFSGKVNYLSDLQGKFGSKLETRVKELLTLASVPNPTHEKVVMARRKPNMICDIMDDYSSEVLSTVPAAREAVSQAFDYAMGSISLARTVPDYEEEGVDEMQIAIGSMLDIMQNTRVMVVHLKSQIEGIPPLSGRVNSSKAKLSRAMQSVIDMIDIAATKSTLFERELLEISNN